MKKAVAAIMLVLILLLSAALCLAEFTSSAFVSPLLTRQSYLPGVMRVVPTPTPTPTPMPSMRGVGGITQVDYSCEDMITSGAGWLHDWTMHPKECGIPVVCQAWGLGSENETPDPRCEIVLLWNEPSIAAQAGISPQVGADRWLFVEQQRDEWGVEISTPCDEATWHSVWANEFYAANGRWPVFDWVCIHSYPAAFTAEQAAASTVAAVEGARVWSLAHGGDGRVVLHEFGVWPAWGEGITEDYMRLVVPQLDEAGVMYAWFALSGVGDYITNGSPYAEYYDTSLVDEVGELTPLGQAYRGL